MGKIKITIHKNELGKYFIKDYPISYKIGKEKMNRWIDIPEYIQVLGEGGISDYSQGFQSGYIKGIKESQQKK